MTSFFYDASNLERISKDETEIVVIHPKTSRLLLTVSMGDVKSDQVNIRNSILSKFGNVQLYSHLKDAHLYVFKRWVLDLITKNQQLSSIKYDLVPLLLECQHRSAVLRREGIHEIQKESPADLFEKARELSVSGKKTLPKVQCTAVVYREGFSARANTVWNYSEINRTLCRMQPQPVPSTSTVDSKTQVGSDSLVGDGCVIQERCSIKRSVIGNHVSIGANCKISNSIIMDYVTIEDGYSILTSVKLDSCVVCDGAKVGSKTALKECEISGHFLVPPSSIFGLI